MLHATTTAQTGPIPYDIVVLTADERHLRRRMLVLQHGEHLFVDLPRPVRLSHGDRLVLEDGRHVEIIAAEEPLYEVRAVTPEALARVAWHLGNRHTRVEISDRALTLQPDHVLMQMLIGLGAWISTIDAPFEPEPPRLTGVPHHHAHD